MTQGGSNCQADCFFDEGTIRPLHDPRALVRLYYKDGLELKLRKFEPCLCGCGNLSATPTIPGVVFNKEGLDNNKVHWSRCCFCGANNGIFRGRIEEHRSRCRWVGAANTFEIMKPNYFKYLREDDVIVQKMKDAISKDRK